MKQSKKRPNVLFILSDDQGEWAMGCSGNTELKTPNLDTLADEGIRFKNYFCTSAVCSPARASILTGKIPSQHGVQDWIRDGNPREGAPDYLEGIPAYTDVLTQNGYTCGISGKWHMGNSLIPQKSFSHWYVHQKGSGDYYNAPMVRNGKPVNEPGYITDLITDNALDFISQNYREDNPFYLSVHYTAPHSPWGKEHHPDEYLDLYKNCRFESVPQQDEPHFDAVRSYSKEDAYDCLRGYYASLTAMDNNIGRLIKHLEALDIIDNTLIIFTSDNGFNCGHHGIWGKGNGTFSLNMYDTSIKVPMIISHKGSIKGREVNDSLLNHYDIMPTLLEYLDIEYEDTENLPGKSFMKILKGEGIDEHDFICVFNEYGPTRMIRTKEYKYVHRYPYGPHEFYNLVKDPQEEFNAINQSAYQDVIESMKAKLDKWFVTYVDPTIDASKEPVRGNGQLTRPGIYSKGKIAFDQNRVFSSDPSYDPGHIKSNKD